MPKTRRLAVRPLGIIAGVVTLWLGGGTAAAKEITTNGAGGGRWSGPATWRGKRVPRATDDAVIQKGDAVVFDRNDVGKVTCRKLFIDPKGVLTFRPRGKRVLCLGDAVESYGTIKLETSRGAKDYQELRLVGDTGAKRVVKLLKGASLLVSGRKGLARDGRNATLAAPPPGGKKADLPGLIEAGAGVLVDIRQARVDNLHLQAAKIDNTGAKANERFNVVGTQFTGQGRISCSECDTPVIAENSFEYKGTPALALPAIQLVNCSLPEARGNHIRGGFDTGILGITSVDGALTGNTVEKCTYGIRWDHGQNGMMKRVVIRGCGTGVQLQFTTALLEGVTVDGATTAVHNLSTTAQLSGLHVTNLAKKDGVALLYENGAVTLINCNIKAAQIKLKAIPAKGPTTPPALVTAMYYLVAAVKGAPAGAQVVVRTVKPAPPAKGAADLNVRNSPAGLSKGLTPLPQSLKPLIVKAWSIDNNSKTTVAPEYQLQVLAPAAKEGEQRRVLKTLAVTPKDSWFRPKPNAPTPTLKVSLK
jgi:hypothetical protein